MRFFVTGIDTEIGKTVVSAILTEALQADYWKPVQSGDLDNSDTMKVKRLISNKKSVFHEETYRLNTCLLYTSPSPRDLSTSRMPSSA